MNRVLSLIALIPLLSSAAGAADGVWTLRERFCLTLDGERDCSRGSEDFMLFEGKAYYRGDAGDSWTEVGTVATKGSRFTVRVTREGVGRLVESRTGVDVTDLLQDFSFTYTGRVQGERIVDGRARVNLRLEVRGETHQIRGNATFRGRRIGNAYPIPPPDPYFGEPFSVRPRGSTAAGTLSAVKAEVHRLLSR